VQRECADQVELLAAPGGDHQAEVGAGVGVPARACALVELDGAAIRYRRSRGR